MLVSFSYLPEAFSPGLHHFLMPDSFLFSKFSDIIGINSIMVPHLCLISDPDAFPLFFRLLEGSC